MILKITINFSSPDVTDYGAYSRMAMFDFITADSGTISESAFDTSSPMAHTERFNGNPISD